MKLLIITFTVALSFFTKSTLANDVHITPNVLQSFHKGFTNVNDVNWTQTQNMYKAQFQINGQHVNAYYKADGTMVALTRNINSFQLPVALQAELKKEIENNWISELMEITNDEGTHYYVTLETADAKVILKSQQAATWTTFQKFKKD